MRWDGIWTHRPSNRPVCRLCLRGHTFGPSTRSRSGINLNYTPNRLQAEFGELSCDSWSACSTSPSDRDVPHRMLTDNVVQTKSNDIYKRKCLKPSHNYWLERESSSCSTSRNSARRSQVNSFSRHTYFHRNCYTAPSPRSSLGSITPCSRSPSRSKSPRLRVLDVATTKRGTHRARKDVFEIRRQVKQVNSVDVQTNPPSTRSFGTSPIIIQDSLISIPRVSSPSNASSLTAVLEEPEERKSSDFSPFVLTSTRLHPPMELMHRKTKEEDVANDRIMNTLKRIYLHDKHCNLKSTRQSFNSGHTRATRTPPPRRSRKLNRAQANRKHSIKMSTPYSSGTNSELKNESKEYVECCNHYIGNDIGNYIGNDKMKEQALPQCWSESNSSLERNKDHLNVENSYPCGLSPYLSQNVAKTYSLGTQSSLSSVWDKPEFECVKTTNITSEIKSKYIKEINATSLYDRDRISACGPQNVFLSTTKDWELNQSVSPIPVPPEEGRGTQKVSINQSKNTTRKISVSRWSNPSVGSSFERGNKSRNVHRTTSKSGSSSDRLDAKKNSKQHKKIPRRKPPTTVRRRSKGRAASGNMKVRSVSSGGSRSSGPPSRSESRRMLHGSKSTRSPQRTTSSPTKRSTLRRGSGRSNTSGSRPASKTGTTPTRGATPRVYSGSHPGGYGGSTASPGAPSGGGVSDKTRPGAARPVTQRKLGTKGGTKAPRHKRPPGFYDSSHKIKNRSSHPDYLREGGRKSHGYKRRHHGAGLNHDTGSIHSFKMGHDTGSVHSFKMGYDTGSVHSLKMGDMDFRMSKVDKHGSIWDNLDEISHHSIHGANIKSLHEDDKYKVRHKSHYIEKPQFGGRKGGGPCGSKEGPCSADNDFSLLKCIGAVDASTQCHCTNGTQGHACIEDCPGHSFCMNPLLFASAGTQVEQQQVGLTQVVGSSYGNAPFGGAPFEDQPIHGIIKTGGTQATTSSFGENEVPYLTARIVPGGQSCAASKRQDNQVSTGLGPSGLPSALRKPAIPPGSIPPVSTQPGPIPPGSVPPGSIQPGFIPPGSIPPGKILESRGVGSSLALPPCVGVGSGNVGRNPGDVCGGGTSGMMRKTYAPCDGIVRRRAPCEQKHDPNVKPLREVQREPPTVYQCGPPCNTGIGGRGGFNAPTAANGPMAVPIGGSAEMNSSMGVISGGMAPVQGNVCMNAPMTCGSLQPYNNPTMVGGSQMVSQQIGGPQMISPQIGGSQMVSPQIGGPQMVSPQIGGPQMVSPQIGGPQMVSPQIGGPQMVSPQIGGPQVVAGRPGGRAICGLDKSVQCGGMRRNMPCNMMTRSAGGMGAELSDRPRRWSVSTQCGGLNTQQGNNTFSHVNVGGVQCRKTMERCQSMYFDSISGGCGAGVKVPPQKQDATPHEWPGGIGPNDPPPWDIVTQVWPEELLPWVGWNLDKLSMYGVPSDPPVSTTCTPGLKMVDEEKMRQAHIRQRQWGIEESRRLRQERTRGSRRSRASSRRSADANSRVPRSSRGSRRSANKQSMASRASKQPKTSTQSKPSMQSHRSTQSQRSMQSQRSTQSRGSMHSHRSTQSQGSMHTQRSKQSQGSIHTKASKGSIQSGRKSTKGSTKSR